MRLRRFSEFYKRDAGIGCCEIAINKTMQNPDL